MVYTFGPQMRAFVFFVYLCFLLLRGNDCVHAAIPTHSIGYSLARPIEKTQSAIFQHADQEQAEIKNTGSNEEKESLLFIDVEDEHDVLVRKFRSFARSNLTNTLTFIPGDPWGYSNDRLPFCCHLSYKYLIQRALRV